MAETKMGRQAAKGFEALLDALHRLINPQTRQPVPVRSDHPACRGWH
jgi:hypothetical protein